MMPLLAAITVSHYLAVGAVLFVTGVLCMATKRNALGVLMGIELVLNGANINFVAFGSKYLRPETLGLDGHHRRLMLRAIDHIAEHSDTRIIFVSHSAGETPACINQHLTFEPRDDGFEVVCRAT